MANHDPETQPLVMTLVRFALPLVSVVISLLIAFQTYATDLNVEWPEGWSSSRQPALLDAQGQPTGSRQRAVLQDKDGNQLAAMEVTRLAVPKEHAVSIENVIATMRKALQFHYAQLGLLANCTKPTETALGDLRGLQVMCTMTARGETVLKHALVTAAGGQVVYSLEYAAVPIAFSEHLQEFLQVRKLL